MDSVDCTGHESVEIARDLRITPFVERAKMGCVIGFLYLNGLGLLNMVTNSDNASAIYQGS